MHSSDKAALARSHREAAEIGLAASDSVAQSTEHVRQSKAAVERSLRLLRETTVSG